MHRSSSVFYGWYITAAYATILMIVVGTLFGSFGLFVLPVSAEFGLSRAEMNTAFILLNVGAGVMAPFIGRAIDRFPARWLMLLGILSFGSGLGILSVSRSLWLSGFAMLVLLPVAMLASGTILSTVVLARWFKAQRGRAILLAQSGSALGSIVVAPIIALLISAEGWRSTLAIVAGGATVLLLLLLAVIRERPGAAESEGKADDTVGVLAERARVEDSPIKVTELLRTRLFWLTAFSFALPMCMAQAITVTLIPLAVEAGISPTKASTLGSIAGFAAVASSISLSTIADKFDRLTLLITLALLGTAMGILPLIGDSYPILATASFLIGVSSGTLAPLFYALFADRFGVASLGTVRGLIQPFSALMGALAIRFAGEVFDRTGDYTLLFQLMIVLHLVAALLIWVSRSVPRPTDRQVAVDVA